MAVPLSVLGFPTNRLDASESVNRQPRALIADLIQLVGNPHFIRGQLKLRNSAVRHQHFNRLALLSGARLVIVDFFNDVLILLYEIS